MQTDVIIVCAGPSGLSMAVQLTRYGIPFIIIAPQTIIKLSKAEVVLARSLEIFDL